MQCFTYRPPILIGPTTVKKILMPISRFETRNRYVWCKYFKKKIGNQPAGARPKSYEKTLSRGNTVCVNESFYTCNHTVGIHSLSEYHTVYRNLQHSLTEVTLEDTDLRSHFCIFMFRDVIVELTFPFLNIPIVLVKF